MSHQPLTRAGARMLLARLHNTQRLSLALRPQV
jgi:hypothetical protein